MARKRIIKIDDIDPYDLGFMALADYRDDATYSFDADLLQIPKRPGYYKINEKIEAREIEVNFLFNSKNNVEIDLKLEELNNLFFDIYGNRKRVKTELRHWRGKHTYAYLKEITKQEIDNNFSKVQVILISIDPFKYSNEIKSIFGQFGSQEINWGSTTVTFSDPYTFGYSSTLNPIPLTIEIINGGVISYPEITIKGKADSVTITANGRSINVPTFEGTLEISRYISYLNGQEKFINAINFFLVPGKNIISVTGTNAEIDITFNVREVFK